MATLTIAQKLAIAEISEYLASLELLRGNKSIPFDLPQKIRNLRKPIEYRYALDSSDDTLGATSDYMISLCWNVNGAKAIILNPGTVGGILAGSTPNPYQFEVDASTSFIIDGQSSKTITAFIGYNLLFVRSNITQSTVNNGGSYYSWTKATGSLIIYPAANTGELFQLYAIS